MAYNTENIALEIEGTILEYNRNRLIQNSSYFQAMLCGKFVESNLKTVKLEGVDLEAMKLILQQLENSTKEIILKYEQILMVLQTAQMLQFETILKSCIEYITSVLNEKNCIEVWFLTEQLSITPLFMKAKSIALAEFATIKDSGCLLDLNINQIYTYLGNRALKINNELDVFETLMQWWFHNETNIRLQKIQFHAENFETPEEKLLYLLSCIDFQSMSIEDVKSMSAIAHLSGSPFIEQLITCICSLKHGNTENVFMSNVLKYAECLLKSRNREQPMLPCITAKMEKAPTLTNPTPAKKLKTVEKSTDVLFFDYETTKDMQILLEIAAPFTHFCEKLEGYKVYGHKNHIFIIGGEYTMGTGDWNKNIWSYNFIDAKWERVQTMVRERRHFKICRVQDEVFIVGGTGPCRVLLDSIIAFSLNDYTLGSRISLPFSVRFVDIECCEHDGNLFLLPKDLNTNKIAYMYNHLNNWRILTLCDPAGKIVKYPGRFSMFSYRNKIYVKGECQLIEMEVQQSLLRVNGSRPTKSITSDNQVEDTVLCGNVLHTFAKHSDIFTDNEFYSVERFNMDTFDEETVIFNIPADEAHYNWKITSGCFGLTHYKLLEKNQFVNETFLQMFKDVKYSMQME